MKKVPAILMALATALNVQPEKLTELLDNKQEAELDNEAIEKLFGDALRTKLSGIMTTHELEKKKLEAKAKDEGYKSAERKVKTELEKQLSEAFGISISDDAALEDLVSDISSKYANAKGKTGALTDDDVKKHPAYIQLEKKAAAEMKKSKEEAEAAVETLRKEYGRKEVLSQVGPKALEIFDAKRPILSSDPAKAARQRQLITDALSGYDFETVDGVTIISKDGVILEDDLKNKVTLDKLVAQIADPLFDYKVAEDREAPNADRAGGQQGASSVSGTGVGKYAGPLPKTKMELYQMTANPNIPLEQRTDLMAWGNTQTALPDE